MSVLALLDDQLRRMKDFFSTSAKVAKVGNLLAGLPLRYLIGADAVTGLDGYITEVPYGHKRVKGFCIAYCNLFDEFKTGKYGPYLKTSDTARQYNEGQIDPAGPGWRKNLIEQFEQRRSQGFEYIELDNPDAYSIEDVIGAIELAAQYGLKVIAKNPGLLERGATEYVKHPNVYGIIIEKDAGRVHDMHNLRITAGKPLLPMWFVAFEDGGAWARIAANQASGFYNIGVTLSPEDEYTSSMDLSKPIGVAP